MKKYKASLKNTPGPVSEEDIPDIKVDMRGIIAYAKEKGVQPVDLSKSEKELFIT